MTQLPTLTTYPGAVPDKSTMDKDEFANAVHPYLNWFNDTYTPQMQSWTEKMNTLSGEVQTASDTAQQAASDAEDARDAAYAATNFRGPWDANTEYSVGETVLYSDQFWVSVQGGTGHQPDISPDYWHQTTGWKHKEINADYAADNKEMLRVDTSAGAVTVTLPASPVRFATVGFADLKSAFATNNLTIVRNGATIMGLDEDMTVSTNNVSFKLIYNNGDWRIV